MNYFTEADIQTIDLGARTIQVIYRSESELTDYGEWKGDYDYLIMRKNLRFSTGVDTILHELLHGLIDISGYKFDDHEEEEDFVCRLTPWLHILVERNPGLMQSLSTRGCTTKGSQSTTKGSS